MQQAPTQPTPSQRPSPPGPMQQAPVGQNSTQRPPHQGQQQAPDPTRQPAQQAPEPTQQPAQQAPEPTQQPAQPPTPPSGAGSLDTEAVRRSWPEVLDKVKEIRRVTWTLVSVNATVLDFDGRRVLLGLSSEGLAATFNQGNHAEVVRQALIEAIGLDTRVECGVNPGGGSSPRPGASSPDSTGPGGTGAPGGPGVGGPGPNTRPSADRASADRGRGPQGEPGPAGQPSAAEQLGVVSGGGSAPRRAGAPPAQEWSESAREAPPAWATEDPEPGPQTEPQTSSTPGPESDPASGAKSAARPGSQSAPPPTPRPTPQEAPTPQNPPPTNPSGDLPGDDDEDLETSGAVGLPVIESVLGGTVISIDDDPTH